MDSLIPTDWQSLAKILIIGPLAYLSVVLILRATGKRTLSKMNAFDFVITIALGSILAATVLDPKVPVLRGALAFCVLTCLQFAITWTSVRLPWVRKLVTGEARLIAYQGRYLEDAMRRERVTREEIQAALRKQGLVSIERAGAVILETDGSCTVVARSAGDLKVLRDRLNEHKSRSGP